ncbi:hypothetical protein KUTeg_006528 [Tegillarca granosa]|uniref:Uncharacterized protein n=1 Tax=Tegillarca granosa TaxID=220873 RepID=A0ABQ9FF40_TEGGR|nr:hypothetical protein KUTeg_006528 [Tegillarca granosa]
MLLHIMTLSLDVCLIRVNQKLTLNGNCGQIEVGNSLEVLNNFNTTEKVKYHPTKDSVKDALSDLKDDFDDGFDNADSVQTKIVKEISQNNKHGKEDKIGLNPNQMLNANDSVISPKKNNVHIQEKDFVSSRKGADKKHCCLYCNKVIPQMPRHLKRKHADEIEVARAMACPQEKDRKLGIKSLIYEGDYQHNYNVLENGQGVIIPRYSKRRGAEKVKTVKELVPCEHCKALFGCTELYRHKCPLKTLKETVQSSCSRGVKGARLLLPLPVQHKYHSQLYKTVICNMQEGEVKIIVEKDSLIKEFGSRQLENVDKEVSSTQVISTKMRELARLMIAFADIDSNILHLKQAILPINWEKLLTAIKNVAGYNVSTGRYEIPSLALKLGYSLKHCANIAYCHAIIDGDETTKKNYIDFLQLYNTEFYTRISSKAQYTLHIDKFNKPLLLPLSEDVTALHNHLKKEVAAIMASQEPNYQDLAEAVLAQVILFNRKRSGEAQRMKLEHFKNAVKKSITPPDKEILNSLTKFEAALCTSVLRVEIRGKRGRKVPVLLTEDMQKGVHMLIKLRKNPEVQPKRDYLFARPLDAKTPFYGNVAIRKHTMLCGAKQPELMTSTGLRKQLGTMCQVLALSEQQQDILANFMGHDLQVHREFYRLPESYFEVAKVTKILHAINEGRISEFKGKDYDSIIINNDGKSLDHSNKCITGHCIIKVKNLI